MYTGAKKNKQKSNTRLYKNSVLFHFIHLFIHLLTHTHTHTFIYSLCADLKSKWKFNLKHIFRVLFFFFNILFGKLYKIFQIKLYIHLHTQTHTYPYIHIHFHLYKTLILMHGVGVVFYNKCTPKHKEIWIIFFIYLFYKSKQCLT